MCLLQRKDISQHESLKFHRRNEYINKYTDIVEELGNSVDTSFTSDTSAQADIVIRSRQESDKKSCNCNRFASRNITENNEQTSPLSMINDDRSMIHLDRFADKLSKNYVRQTFLKNKRKKYKKCSCRKQCPYALYKLPCNKYRCSTPEKKVEDEISGLTLECLSFGEKRDFPKFINVDTVRNSECCTDSSPVEIGMDESLTSSLSVDLEVDICNDYCDLEEVDEFTERRKARTYIVNRTNMRKDDLIKGFRAENEPSFNIISSWRNVSEKKEKIDEIVKKVLSQERYIYSEENSQGYKKSGTGNFISDPWPLKNSKQIQCVIPALTTPVFNRKISEKTSTSNVQQKGIQTYRTTDKTKYNSFPKIIIPRRIKTNVQTQVGKRSCLNSIQHGSSALDNCTNRKNAKETDVKDEGKMITRKKNICDICAIEMDALSSEIIWPRMKKSNIYSALQAEEDIKIHSNKAFEPNV
ncbi:uncharacterized protein LOC112455318 [Temnothorax curvispinosus]|uniref:Uncharacterized protein LOC112455318 n=1 Tax=Temnothorax curvispinosus TaxID=300111 RepID=A0A6J1PUC8_9HYME|nr:uncharacterized protein LOC112455318 [Temnothorax curvispinosus]